MVGFRKGHKDWGDFGAPGFGSRRVLGFRVWGLGFRVYGLGFRVFKTAWSIAREAHLLLVRFRV